MVQCFHLLMSVQWFAMEKGVWQMTECFSPAYSFIVLQILAWLRMVLRLITIACPLPAYSILIQTETTWLDQCGCMWSERLSIYQNLGRFQCSTTNKCCIGKAQTDQPLIVKHLQFMITSINPKITCTRSKVKQNFKLSLTFSNTLLILYQFCQLDMWTTVLSETTRTHKCVMPDCIYNARKLSCMSCQTDMNSRAIEFVKYWNNVMKWISLKKWQLLLL